MTTLGPARMIVVSLAAALLAACTSGDQTEPPEPPGAATGSTTTSSTPSTTSTPTSSDDSEPTATPTETTPPPKPAEFRIDAAMRTVRFLAGEIGPREATTAAYRRAAGWVQQTFESSGYDVARQRFRAPAGNSWGIDVPAGMTWNVVATPAGFDQSKPYRIVGAHLDTVPQAPGAEDNASGVSVLLEVARMAALESPKVPTMFVAFGAEEPRGDGDSLHHFGSTAMVERLTPVHRDAMQAMVALDRVGVGTVVPLCTGGLSPLTVRSALERSADRADIASLTCLNTASDHWSFEKAGMPVARIGSTPYAAYHSAGDVPRVVNPAQLGRVGQVLWGWLSL